MTDIIIIAAVAENGVIGRKNDIPWRISEDFKRFKSMTMGYPCIMGDSTYRSLPDSSRPLPGRENIVLTLDPNYKPPGVTIFNDFNKAIAYIKDLGVDKAFITGGSTIYKLGLDVADYVELTLLHKEFDGDVMFPYWDEKIYWGSFYWDYLGPNWELIQKATNESIDRVSGQNIKFSYITYRRQRSSKS